MLLRALTTSPATLMDIASIRAFLAVAELGSFTDAAAKLHLTQPAISKRVATLEGQLGSPLFDRIGRQVTLTHAGRALLPHASAIVDAVLEAARAVQAQHAGIAGELTLATSHHLGLHRLPPILRTFSRQYPEVQLVIEFMDSEKAHDAVLRGEAEVGVVTLAPAPLPLLQAQPIWPDPLAVMVSCDHALARSVAPSLAELSANPAVLPGLGTYTGRMIKERFAARHLPLQISMSTNYLETIRMLVCIGFGWTVLPRSMLLPDLVCLDVAGLQLARMLGCIHHQRRALSPAARALLAAMANASPLKNAQ